MQRSESAHLACRIDARACVDEGLYDDVHTSPTRVMKWCAPLPVQCCDLRLGSRQAVCVTSD